jgi:hypothetical protein
MAATPRQQCQLKHDVANLWTRFPLYRILHHLKHSSAPRTTTMTSGQCPQCLNHISVLEATPLPRAQHCCFKNNSTHLETTMLAWGPRSLPLDHVPSLQTTSPPWARCHHFKNNAVDLETMLPSQSHSLQHWGNVLASKTTPRHWGNVFTLRTPPPPQAQQCRLKNNNATLRMTTPASNDNVASKPQPLALGQHAHLEENPPGVEVTYSPWGRRCHLKYDGPGLETAALTLGWHTHLEDTAAISSTTTLSQAQQRRLKHGDAALRITISTSKQRTRLKANTLDIEATC